MNYKCLLLTFFIILLLILLWYLPSYTQVKAESTVTELCLDSADVTKINLIWEERDYLKVENDSLKSLMKIKDNKLKLYEMMFGMKDTIIYEKDKQLKKYEMTPVPVIVENKTSWTTIFMIVVTCLSAGITTGLLVNH